MNRSETDTYSGSHPAEKNQVNLVDLSAYAFGLSGLWNGIGGVVLPFKVLEILEDGSAIALGYSLDKNGTLGLISLVGLAVAALVRPWFGFFSDRTSMKHGKRLPYMMVGALGLAGASFYFASASTFIAVTVAIVAMQLFGNLLQGPGNALLVDRVPRHRIGAASGALNLARVAGAGIVTLVALRLMANFDPAVQDPWMWATVGAMAGIVLITTTWSVVRLRNTDRHALAADESRPAPEALLSDADPTPAGKEGGGGRYLWFLIGLGFVVAATSSLEVYSLFFLQDVIGLENPADGATILVLMIAVFTALTVLPAGMLADRVGQDKLLALSGGLGATAALSLLFVTSIASAIPAAAMTGAAVGIFLSVAWAMAAGNVARATAGRDLGFIGIPWLIGATVARAAGPGIDALNQRSDALGYEVMLICVAAAFLIAATLMARLVKQVTPAEQSVADHA